MKRVIFLFILMVVFISAQAQQNLRISASGMECSDITLIFYAVDDECNIVGETNPITITAFSSGTNVYTPTTLPTGWATDPSTCSCTWHWAYFDAKRPVTCGSFSSSPNSCPYDEVSGGDCAFCFEAQYCLTYSKNCGSCLLNHVQNFDWHTGGDCGDNVAVFDVF